MSGSVTPYSITPSLGVGLNMWWSTTGAGSVGTTGPNFPTDAMQLGMSPGMVMRANNASRYILVRSAAALAANASVTTGPPNFVVGTGTGISGTAPNIAIPANALFWANIGV